MPCGVSSRTLSLPASAAAMARQRGAMARKSAWIPPRTIIPSVNWVSTSPRAPAAVASLTACVWVMERLTAQRNTSEARMAAAMAAGGS